MKIISVTKLNKAKKAAEQIRLYNHELSIIFNKVAFSQDPPLQSIYFVPSNTPQKILLLFRTADRGFCGPLNSTLIEKALEEYHVHTVAGQSVDLLPIGQKAINYLDKHKLPYLQNYAHLSDNITFKTTERTTGFLLKSFQKQIYHKIVLLYQDKATLEPTNIKIQQLLPIIPKSNPSPINFIYEPSLPVIIEYLVPRIVHLQLYSSLLKASIAEHTARIINMEKASSSAEKLLNELKLLYNRSRQEAITRQIIEIAATVEALKD